MNKDFKLTYVGMFPKQRRETREEIKTLIEKTVPKTACLEIRKKGEQEYHVFPEKRSVEYFFSLGKGVQLIEFSLKEGWPRFGIESERARYFFYQFPRDNSFINP